MRSCVSMFASIKIPIFIIDPNKKIKKKNQKQNRLIYD